MPLRCGAANAAIRMASVLIFERMSSGQRTSGGSAVSRQR